MQLPLAMHRKPPFASTCLMLWLLQLAESAALGAPDDVGEEPPKYVERAGFDDNDLDTLIFSGDDRNLIQARQEAFLKEKIELLSRTRYLDAEQQRKLLLAGRGDIKRRFDEVEETKQRFLAQRDRNRGEMLKVARELRATVTEDPFHNFSLYWKTRRTILERRQRYYRDAIEPALVMLQKTLDLHQDQREELAFLLMEDESQMNVAAEDGDGMMMNAFANMPDEKLSPFFDSRQWELMQRPLKKARFLRNIRD